MRNKDWSLVFFTVLSQMSVGVVFCVAGLVGVLDDSRFLNLLGPQLKNPVLLALLSVGVATGLSFLHLGKKSNAPRSLNNLAGSWVSREILALGMYSFSLLAVFILGWNSWAFEVLSHLLLLSSIIGIVFLWTMTRIYVIPTIPPWNSWYTPLSFFSTAICLGLMTVLVVHYSVLAREGCVVCYAQFLGDPTSRLLLVFLALTLFLEMVGGMVHQSRLAKMDTGIDRLSLGRGNYYRLFLTRMALVALSLLVMSMLLFRLNLDSHHAWVYYLLPALVVAQALLGRLLFFSSYFRLGV